MASPSLRRRMTVLLALYFALRLLIPPGFMLSPEALAAGSLQVTICDGFGVRQVVVDEDGRIVDPQPAQHDRDSYCDFALATIVAHLPPAQGLIALATGVEDLVPAMLAGDLVPSQAQGPPLGSRAPPPPA